MSVSSEDRDAMARIMMAMEGKSLPATAASNNAGNNSIVELAGPGQVTNAEINAMADVLTKLNSITNQVVDNMITESKGNREVRDALVTSKNQEGVKVGLYQIMIKEDDKRLAGKQYYSLYNTKTGDIIADDISLYETALNVIKLMNNGKYANSQEVRTLFENDDSYTSHKQDAIRYKRAMIISERKNDLGKRDLYESRYQASMDRAMIAKKEIKRFKIAG